MRLFICFIDIFKTFLGNPIALKSVKAAQKVKVGDDSEKWDHVWNLNSQRRCGATAGEQQHILKGAHVG